MAENSDWERSNTGGGPRYQARYTGQKRSITVALARNWNVLLRDPERRVTDGSKTLQRRGKMGGASGVVLLVPHGYLIPLSLSSGGRLGVDVLARRNMVAAGAKFARANRRLLAQRGL